MIRTLRLVAALSALVAGGAHLKLYADGYSDIPVANIGTQFLLNAATAVVIAAGLVAPLVIAPPQWLQRAVPALGVGWGVMSLIAFFVARQGSGWFGFREQSGLNPAPEAHLSVFPELIVVLCCAVIIAATFRTTMRERDGVQGSYRSNRV